MKTTTYIEMDYGEFEELVEKEYGAPYSFVASEECGNDTDHSYTITGVVDEPDELEKFRAKCKDIAEYNATLTDEYKDAWRRKEVTFMYSSGVLLEDMVARGIIPAGNYLIHVSW